jgi:hypothetical protein
LPRTPHAKKKKKKKKKIPQTSQIPKTDECTLFKSPAVPSSPSLLTTIGGERKKERKEKEKALNMFT